jgi:hypothetical protein
MRNASKRHITGKGEQRGAFAFSILPPATISVRVLCCHHVIPTQGNPIVLGPLSLPVPQSCRLAFGIYSCQKLDCCEKEYLHDITRRRVGNCASVMERGPKVPTRDGNRKHNCWANKSSKRIEKGHWVARDGPGGHDGMRITALNHLASLLCSGPARTAKARNTISFHSVFLLQ